MKSLKQQIESYFPFNEQEAADKQQFLEWLNSGKNLFLRENKTAHITVSAWIVSPDRKKVLMAYHNIYDSWSWLGGHADGERNLLKVAVREVMEESGLKQVRPVAEEVYSLEILTVDEHVKRGVYVPSHLHLNVTYLLEADEHGQLRVKEDENSGVAWFAPGDAVLASTEPWMRERIYMKLNAKMKL